MLRFPLLYPFLHCAYPPSFKNFLRADGFVFLLLVGTRCVHESLAFPTPAMESYSHKLKKKSLKIPEYTQKYNVFKSKAAVKKKKSKINPRVAKSHNLLLVLTHVDCCRNGGTHISLKEAFVRLRQEDQKLKGQKKKKKPKTQRPSGLHSKFEVIVLYCAISKQKQNKVRRTNYSCLVIPHSTLLEATVPV